MYLEILSPRKVKKNSTVKQFRIKKLKSSPTIVLKVKILECKTFKTILE